MRSTKGFYPAAAGFTPAEVIAEERPSMAAAEAE
jgi:hypothetical protein